MNRFSKLSLIEIMSLPLPKMSDQRTLKFRPTLEEVEYIYELLNKSVFDKKLKRPKIILRPRCRKFWGMCSGDYQLLSTGSYCEILLMNKWVSVQWMIMILSHEICHQFTWDVEGNLRDRENKDRLMNHNTTFWKYKQRLLEFHIPLKVAYSQSKWFKTQDLFKT